MFSQNARGPAHGARHFFLGLLGALGRPGGVKIIYFCNCSTIFKNSPVDHPGVHCLTSTAQLRALPRAVRRKKKTVCEREAHLCYMGVSILLPIHIRGYFMSVGAKHTTTKTLKKRPQKRLDGLDPHLCYIPYRRKRELVITLQTPRETL